MNGVIETETGYLLRCGHCNFNVSPFNPLTETLVYDVPDGAIILHDCDDTPEVTRWTGSAWETVVP